MVAAGYSVRGGCQVAVGKVELVGSGGGFLHEVDRVKECGRRQLRVAIECGDFNSSEIAGAGVCADWGTSISVVPRVLLDFASGWKTIGGVIGFTIGMNIEFRIEVMLTDGVVEHILLAVLAGW
eukprot:1366417-Amorphochlora_amoeboformis.AAC.1